MNALTDGGLAGIADVFHDALVDSFPRGPDGRTPQYPSRFCDWMNILDDRAHGACECGWVPPYGFVIEAGCPIHEGNPPSEIRPARTSVTS